MSQQDQPPVRVSVRDHSPKRSDRPLKSSAAVSDNQPAPAAPVAAPILPSLKDKVSKWLRIPAGQQTEVVGHGKLRWSIYERPANRWIKENIPECTKHLPYHGVVLYFLCLCYNEKLDVETEQLGVLMTRLTDASDRAMIERFCERVNPLIERLHLADSPFWMDLNAHIYRRTGWYTHLCTESARPTGKFEKQHWDVNFTLPGRHDDGRKFWGLAPPMIRGGIDSEFLQRLRNARRDAEKIRATEETHPGIGVDRRKLHAEAMVQQIEEFIFPRLTSMLPYFKVELPKFNGRSRLFEQIIALQKLDHVARLNFDPENKSLEFGFAPKNPQQ